MLSSPTSRENIERLFRPRHIAFFGGRAIEQSVRYLEALGFKGEIWIVNPHREFVVGHKCFRQVDDLPAAPDASFIAVRPEITVEVVRDLAARGSAGAVCYAAGFKELGRTGENLHKDLLRAAGPMAIVGPNATGIINFFDRAAVALEEMGLACPERGVAIITQSGSFADNSSRNDRGLPIGYLLSTGNQSMLESADYMEVLLDDVRVSAIGLHMEGLWNVDKFHKVSLRALRQGVPIVVLKTGISQRGIEAANSHTAALAGNDELFTSLFYRLGITRTGTLLEFIETLKLFAINGPLKGNRVAILTCSGFDCSNAADIAEQTGLVLPNPSDSQNQELAKSLTEFSKPSNPLDCAMAMWGDRVRQANCFQVMMREPYDMALLIVTFPVKINGDVGDWDAAVCALIDAKQATGFPCICASNLSEGLPAPVRAQLQSEGIASLQGLSEAMFAIHAAADYLPRRQFILDTVGLRHSPISVGPITDQYVVIDEWYSKRWLSSCGVATPQGKVTTTSAVAETAAEIGFPVVVKALKPGLLHKSDAGAIAIGVRSKVEADEAARRIDNALQRDADSLELKFIVEKFVIGGIAELIIGIKRDLRFGLVLVVGSGGIFAELHSDVVRLLLPTTREELQLAISKLKVAALLSGHRGRPPADLEAAIDAIMKITAEAESMADELVEFDLNPLIVLQRGQGIVAVDALLIIEAAGHSSFTDDYPSASNTLVKGGNNAWDTADN